MDGTKQVPWAMSPLPLLYPNPEFPLTSVRTPVRRVPEGRGTRRCPHRCCSRCRGPHSSLRCRRRRVCVPTRKVSARSFLPGTAGFRRCRCNSPALLRSRCWDRSSGPCSWDRRAGTARGRGEERWGRVSRESVWGQVEPFPRSFPPSCRRLPRRSPGKAWGKVGRRQGAGREVSQPTGTYLPDVHVQDGAFAPDGAVLDVASGGESQEPQEADGERLAGHGCGVGKLFGFSSRRAVVYI